MKVMKNGLSRKKTVYPRLGVYTDELASDINNGTYYIQFREDTDWYALSGGFKTLTHKYSLIKPLSDGEQITLTQE